MPKPRTAGTSRLTRRIVKGDRPARRCLGASFVSVTQSFNTATSLGRLTLNVLLSFAQFEREVTAERIRRQDRSLQAQGPLDGGLVPFGFEFGGAR